MKSIKQILSELNSFNTYETVVHPIKRILIDVPEGTYIYKCQLLILLTEGLSEKDPKKIQYLISICFHDGVDEDYTNVLCNLLQEDWHYMHEDIITMLEEIKDPNSVPCIYETSLNIPDYDDGRSLAKKCIWALGAINTDEAKEKLRLLADSNDQQIKEAALFQLEDH